MQCVCKRVALTGGLFEEFDALDSSCVNGRKDNSFSFNNFHWVLSDYFFSCKTLLPNNKTSQFEI